MLAGEVEEEVMIMQIYDTGSYDWGEHGGGKSAISEGYSTVVCAIS